MHVAWSWRPSKNSLDSLSWGFISELSFPFLFAFMPAEPQSWILSLCGRFWNQEVWDLQVWSSFSILFWLLRVSPLWLHSHFGWDFLFLQKSNWHMDINCIESVDCFGECWPLNNNKFSYWWTGYLFIFWCLLSFHKAVFCTFQCISLSPWLFIFNYFISDAIINGIFPIFSSWLVHC